MPERYCCPNCRGNRRRFEVIRHFAQELEKDPHTGDVEFASDEWTAVMDGERPELEVVCKSCGYRGRESLFVKAAENYSQGSAASPINPS